MANLEEVGVRAIVEGASQYVSDGNRVNKATIEMGAAAKSAADSYKVFEQAQKAAQAQLRETGTRMQEVGRQAILLGGALAAPGIVATKLASDFEASIVKLHTLSGVAVDDLDSMRQGILSISRTSGRGPQELADALLVVTSTGIKGAEALNILDASAKLSAIGLGETTTISRALTGALNAFAQQNLTAAQAAGILLATVREGGAEVTEVAGSLGRVNAIAANVGVTFADVGAFVATFTRTGVDADEAVTALRGTLTILLGTSNESRKAIQALGLDLGSLRKEAKEKGLVEALRTIIEATKGNDEAIVDVIPNVRALAGVLSTAQAQGEKYAEVTERIKQSQEDVARAFEATAQTPQFKYQQAIADLQSALVLLGSEGLPILAKLATGVSTTIAVFNGLPGPVKATALVATTATGALIALAGGLALVAGTVVRLLADLPVLLSAMRAINIAVVTSPAGWIAIAGAVLVAAAAYLLVKGRIDEVNRSLLENTAAQRIANSQTQESIRVGLVNLELRRDEAKATLEQMQAAHALPDEIVRQNKAYQALNDLVGQYHTALGLKTAAELDSVNAAAKLSEQQKAVAASVDSTVPAIVRLSENAKKLKQDIEGVTAASLAWKIIDEDLKNIQGATPENLFDLISPETIQRQAEMAGKLLKPYLDFQNRITKITEGVQNAAGGLTKEQTKDANAAQREADRAIEEEARRVQKAIEDANRAAEQMAAQRVQNIDQFGELIATALKRAAQKQLDITLQTLDAQKDATVDTINAEIEAIKKRTDAAVKAAETARDAGIKAIEQERDARIASINAQIDALQGDSNTEQRTELQRKIALAFDPKERADAEKALRDFDRSQQIDALRDQVQSEQDSATTRIDALKEVSTARIEAIKTEGDALVEADQKARDAAIKGFELQQTAARKAYEEQTSDFKIQSQVRQMLINGEVENIGKLLDAQVPEWRSAGLNYGQQMVQGLQKSGVNEYISGLLAQIAQVNAAFGGTAGSSAAAAANAARTQEIAGQQQQGIRAVQGGAPQSVIDMLRDQLIKLGVVPQFATGLDVGVVKRPILAALDPGEVVLTPDQQRQYMGAGRQVTIDMRGAHFTGTPQENWSAARAAFDDGIGDQLGRGAFLAGIG